MEATAAATTAPPVAVEVMQGECCTLRDGAQRHWRVFSLAATTCVVTVLYHRPTGTCSLAHLDSPESCPDMLATMLRSIEKISSLATASGADTAAVPPLSKDAATSSSKATDATFLQRAFKSSIFSKSQTTKQDEIELFMMGGMMVDPGEEPGLPPVIVKYLTSALTKAKKKLVIAFDRTGARNTVVEKMKMKGGKEIEVCKPIVMDVIFDVRTGVMSPLLERQTEVGEEEQLKREEMISWIETEKKRTPERVLRSGQWRASGSTNAEIFDHEREMIRIGPFEYNQNFTKAKIQEFIAQAETDPETFLQHFSTSPLCEPPNFVPDVITSFKHQLAHPKLVGDVFKSLSEPLYFFYDESTQTWKAQEM